MKNYIKPSITNVIFTSEEHYSLAVSCTNGECTDGAGNVIWFGPGPGQ